MRGSVFHPGRLKRKKGALPVDVDTRYAAKTTGSAHDNAEVLVSQLKWSFLRRSLDLNEVAFVL